MRLRRLILGPLLGASVTLFAVGAVPLGGLGFGPAEAEAAKKSRESQKKSKKASKKKAKPSGRLVCSGKGKKKKCRRVRGVFAGRRVPVEELRKEPLPRPSGQVWVYSANLREEARVNIFKPDGSYDDAALAKLDSVFRCRRTGEVRAVDPRLYEILSVIHDHYGHKRIDLTSGFRYQRNEGSRHFHAAAMDIRVDGVPWRELYRFAESLDAGGMGIGNYPHDGFVHIDFRAPGEPSYRWKDTTAPDRKADGRAPSKMFRRSSKPSS